MSQCIFIAADTPLPEVTPPQDYPLHIDLDAGTIFDGGADDNYFLLPFDEMQSDSVEIWNVWLSGYWEFDDRPHICKRTVPIDELTAEDIKEIVQAENWDNKDKNRPWFYCLEII